MKFTLLASLLSIVGLAMLIALQRVIAFDITNRGMSEEQAMLAGNLTTIDSSNRVVILILGICSLLLAIKSLRNKYKLALIPLVLAILLIVLVFLPLWKYMM